MPNRPYGTWPSPITPNTTHTDYRLYDGQWDRLTHTLVWQERRPDGAALVAQTPDGPPRDLIRGGRIGGGLLFGGGGFTVGNGQAVFVGEGGALFTIPLGGGSPRRITPAFGDAASPALSPDGQSVVYIHSLGENECLAIAPTDGSQYPQKLYHSADFFMQPTWHPNGQTLAFISWDHPHMPWDAARLHLMHLGGDVAIIAGENGDESVFGAAFSPNGRYLAYTSDRAGWWQLYVYDMQTYSHHRLTSDQAEYGVPAWLHDMRTFTWSADSRALYALRTQGGRYTMQQVAVPSGKMSHVPGLDAYSHLEQIAAAPQGDDIAVIAGGPQIPDRLITVNAASGQVRPRAYSSTESIDAAYLADVQHITWLAADGTPIHGLYYPPSHPQFTSDGPPPLIVHIHSGPTRQRFARCFMESHFFASRGFAVLEPNYRGSTGFGKAYKDALRGQWGIYDVSDSAAGAEHLAAQGLADRTRLIVMGSSSGGYSVLRSLIDRPGFYRAGIAQAPVTDLFALAADTHKFERYYTDGLVGLLPGAAATYRERSAVFAAGAIQTPLALFHGAEDRVVPVGQSKAVARALGGAHLLKVYEGEGHSFRGVDTQADYYATMLDFIMRHVIYA